MEIQMDQLDFGVLCFLFGYVTSHLIGVKKEKQSSFTKTEDLREKLLENAARSAMFGLMIMDKNEDDSPIEAYAQVNDTMMLVTIAKDKG